MSGNQLVFDIEADALVPTKIHCIGLQWVGEEVRLYEADEIEVALEELATADVMIGHNILLWDIPQLKRLYPEWNPKGEILDTLVMSRVVFADIKNKDFQQMNTSLLPKELIGHHSLKAWGYRLGMLKGAFAEDTDWAEYSGDMGQYCIRDVQLTTHLLNHLEKIGYSPQSVALEQLFAVEIEQQMHNGFAFDSTKAGELYALLGDMRDKLTTKLQQVFPAEETEMKTPQYWEDEDGKQYKRKADAPSKMRKHLKRGPNKVKRIPFNPGSRLSIAKCLTDRYGWQPANFTGDGRPVVDESVLGALPYKEAALLMQYLLVQKRIGQVAEGKEAWLKLENAGRIYGKVRHNSAVSGRCTHSKPNVAQVPSGRSPYGVECRSLFHAPTGRKLVGIDLSQLELRCLAHYAATFDGGAYAKEVVSGDIHTVNQQAAGLKTRDQAKTFIYALIYGAGAHKIGTVVGGNAKDGAKLKRDFYQKIPALRKLTDAVKKRADGRAYLIGLDGRRLPVRSAHSALNLLIQGAGAVIVKQATVLMHQYLRDAGYMNGEVLQVAHIHDEVQFECDEGIAEEVAQICLRAVWDTQEKLGLRIKLDGEASIGTDWSHTH